MEKEHSFSRFFLVLISFLGFCLTFLLNINIGNSLEYTLFYALMVCLFSFMSIRFLISYIQKAIRYSRQKKIMEQEAMNQDI